MSTIIKIENLSKKYIIGHQRRERYTALRDVIMQKLRGMGERLRHPLSPNKEKINLEEIWALKDVNMEIKQGDRLGIIGRNGAGKSTLLKVLSRITEPTTGRITLKGRVASLLEVGTGFHPELTGRENIFLNGAILGMSREEIKKNFDEIVAFAEVEKFLDTPVKRYSSGMYVRLAFAVAAHLEPEILVVDEVLAVGDAQFRKKCLNKMEDVGRQGRTVLFVSHNMAAIRTLCDKAVLLDAGKVIVESKADEVINQYLSFNSEKSGAAIADVRNLPRLKRSNKSVVITKVRLLNEHGVLSGDFAVWEPIEVLLDVDSDCIGKQVSFWILIYSQAGEVVLSSFQYDVVPAFSIKKKTFGISVLLDPIILPPGRYSMSFGAFGRMNEFCDWIDSAITFDIRDEFATGKAYDNRLGMTTMRYKWLVNYD
jgi:lipopolysaccharide transport system ATP-binding protein